MSIQRQSVFKQPLSDLFAGCNGETEQPVNIPDVLYRHFLETYRHAQALGEKLPEVMNNDEHEFYMEEGRAHGFFLPAQDFIRPQTEKLSRLVMSFNPYASQRGPDYAELMPSQLSGYQNVFLAAHETLGSVFKMFRVTQYIEHQRHLRDELYTPYTGPSSLREIIKTHAKLMVTQRMQKAFMDGEALHDGPVHVRYGNKLVVA